MGLGLNNTGEGTGHQRSWSPTPSPHTPLEAGSPHTHFLTSVTSPGGTAFLNSSNL